MNHISIEPSHHLTILLFHQIFKCFIPNYPVKMSKLIQKYQCNDEGLLSQFEKDKIIKGTDVFEVPSWAVVNIP